MSFCKLDSKESGQRITDAVPLKGNNKSSLSESHLIHSKSIQIFKISNIKKKHVRYTILNGGGQEFRDSEKKWEWVAIHTINWSLLVSNTPLITR